MNFLDEHRWSGKVFTGEWTAPDGGTIPVVEPATGIEIGRVGEASLGDLERSVARARQAQAEWAAVSFTERAAVMRRAADLWTQHSAEVHNWLMREAGGIRLKAQYEVYGAVQECLESSGLPSHALGEVLPTDRAQLSMSRRTPVGVVAVIAPFNMPLKLAIRSVAPALALGNAVILKPDPRTPVSGGVVLARVFEEAGLPAGVLHVLPGGGELGGNNAMIVLPDADLDNGIDALAYGSFFNQGQGCMIIGRHLVHESVYDDYVHRLVAKAETLTVGNPMTGDVSLGPVIDAKQRDRIHALVTDSVAAGARLLTGGTYEGLFYRPTVLADAGPGIPAYDQEVFGPVACVTRFSTLDEAVKLACDTEYGLALGIFTADVATGLALAERIPTGTAHINDQTLRDDAQVPFGGVRNSGNASRFGTAAANIEAYTDTRWITVQPTPPAYPF
jgi:benzaldehyde dehydrogenase (NAD)